ncbi:nose resistant to fluoxetine protein 6-like [Haematobia irritans]|uniref:nose resistant to fluoxetine protein 6-like n=1 Tax=Haematobia irritans TaxID=7368 RepID=UPI003F5011A6
MPKFRNYLVIYASLFFVLITSSNSDPVFLTDPEEKSSLAAMSSTYLTPYELKLFADSLEFIKDDNCRSDLNATLQGILNNAQWAVSMIDASVRSAVGLESQVIHQLGHFDQCFQKSFPQTIVTTSESMDFLQPVPVQYCLVNVNVNGLTRLDSNVIETLTSRWGECVPAACSGSDVEIYLQHFLQRNVTVTDNMCQSPQIETSVTCGMIIYASILTFFILLTIFSTVYHVLSIKASKRDNSLKQTMKENNIRHIALLSFSIIENTKKLFQPSRDQSGLKPLNGIKALAMIFILFGHATTFIYGSPMLNVNFFTENAKSPLYGFITNSLLFVDIYLLLSGYLFFRLVIVELERRKGKLNPLFLYIGRYIRLTPAYMVVIGFYMTWLTSISSGPIWRERIELQQDRCLESWWLNILYINNYINTDKLCMFQSWYLSADTQLFFVGPLILIMIHKWRKFGLSLLATLTVITSATPFIVTYIDDVEPTLMINSSIAEDLLRSDYYHNNYMKTHMRASAYFIGLATGYLAHVMQSKSIKLPKILVRFIWTISCIMGIGSMFALGRFYAAPYTTIESTLYAGFHKLFWNLSIGWLVLAVTTGHSGWVRRVLSSRFFVPFSRLTYCAYLCNGAVELYNTSSIRTAESTGYIEILNSMLAHTLNTFALAFLLCLVFESPLHAVERIIMRQLKRRDPNKKTAKSGSSDISPSTSEEQVA